jgi:hypothetical protein
VDTETITPTVGTLPEDGLPDGGYRIIAIATDGVGNDSPETTQDLTVDTTAPAAPTITSPDQTSDKTPVIAGTAEPSSTVTLAIDLDGDGTPDVTYETTADPDGAWSVDTEKATPTSGTFPEGGLSDGNYGVRATATDDVGNTGPEATQTLTVNSTAPDAPVIASPDKTSDNTPVISGTAEAGHIVTLAIDLDGDGTPDVTYETTADENGNWSVDTETATPTSGTFPEDGLPDNDYGLSATSRNNIGTSSDEATQTLTVDTTAPAAPVITSPSQTDDSTPVISGTAEPGHTVTLEIDLDGDGTPDVTYETIADPDGNWNVDTEQETPTSGTLPDGGLSDDEYKLKATSKDELGNVSPESPQTLIVETGGENDLYLPIVIK